MAHSPLSDGKEDGVILQLRNDCWEGESGAHEKSRAGPLYHLSHGQREPVGFRHSCMKEASGPLYHLSHGQREPDAFFTCRAVEARLPKSKSRTNSHSFILHDPNAAVDAEILKT
jgi:hypothetical protein